jgi:hypothetical protein
LAGTADLPLRLSICDDYLFTAYVDASYAVPKDMKSHSGMVYTAGGGTFLAKSTKQSVVSKSSTEAEVIAASDGCNDLLSLMEFINFQTGRQGKVVLFQDNTSAIQLEKNGKSSSNKTKHMKIRYFWIKDKVASGELEIQHLPTVKGHTTQVWESPPTFAFADPPIPDSLEPVAVPMQSSALHDGPDTGIQSEYEDPGGKKRNRRDPGVTITKTKGG